MRKISTHAATEKHTHCLALCRRPEGTEKQAKPSDRGREQRATAAHQAVRLEETTQKGNLHATRKSQMGPCTQLSSCNPFPAGRAHQRRCAGLGCLAWTAAGRKPRLGSTPPAGALSAASATCGPVRMQACGGSWACAESHARLPASTTAGSPGAAGACSAGTTQRTTHPPAGPPHGQALCQASARGVDGAAGSVQQRSMDHSTGQHPRLVIHHDAIERPRNLPHCGQANGQPVRKGLRGVLRRGVLLGAGAVAQESRRATRPCRCGRPALHPAQRWWRSAANASVVM